jgi:hypothetical protein
MGQLSYSKHQHSIITHFQLLEDKEERKLVVHYTTISLIGGKFVQQRAKKRFCNIGLTQRLVCCSYRALVLYRPSAARPAAPTESAQLNRASSFVRVLAPQLAYSW